MLVASLYFLLGFCTEVVQSMADLEAKSAKLNDFMNSDRDRGGRREAYLERPHSERPREGKIVEQAFLAVEVELLDLRTKGAPQACAPASSAGDPPASSSRGAQIPYEFM